MFDINHGFEDLDSALPLKLPLLLFAFILQFREGTEICRQIERGMVSKIKHCEKY